MEREDADRQMGEVKYPLTLLFLKRLSTSLLFFVGFITFGRPQITVSFLNQINHCNHV